VKTIVKSVAAACLSMRSSQASQAQDIDFKELPCIHANSAGSTAPTQI
jgi:hypothetical protein